MGYTFGHNAGVSPHYLHFSHQQQGAMYHVINRGGRREDIFRDDQDRLCFLSAQGEACQKPAGKDMLLHDGQSLSLGTLADGQLDFILNYDIKYRLGREAGEEE